MKTIEMLISRGDTRLVVGMTTGRNVLFTAKMQFGDRLSAMTAYGCSVDAAISSLEDQLMNEIAEDEGVEASCSDLRCPRCGLDSGTADKDKFREWYIAHRALTCRGSGTNNSLTVSPDAQREANTSGGICSL